MKIDFISEVFFSLERECFVFKDGTETLQDSDSVPVTLIVYFE